MLDLFMFARSCSGVAAAAWPALLHCQGRTGFGRLRSGQVWLAFYVSFFFENAIRVRLQTLRVTAWDVGS